MKEVMKRDLITIDKDQNLGDALGLMDRRRISRLLVTEGGRVCGIITEEDIADRLGTGRERKLKTSHIHVSAAMSKDLVVIPTDSERGDAAKIMLENGFSSLPVVEDSEIVGLVTKTDLVRSLIKSEKTVEGFYTKNPVLVNPGDTLVSARKLMLEYNIHRLLVTDRGFLAGILTERDIAAGLKTFRKALDKNAHPDIRGLRVEHVMTGNPVTIKPETTVGEAVEIMLEKGISGIPVITKDFGVLTKTDLVRGIAGGRLP
jgi:CBS domain-containing protein